MINDNAKDLLFYLEKISCQFVGGIKIEITNAEIKRGDRFLISGPSGCGKSTVLGLLSLALQPTHGRKFFFQHYTILDLWKYQRRDQLATLRAFYFGFVPQTAGLIPFLTVRENIMLPQSIIHKKNNDWFDKLVRYLEISSILAKKPNEISVGQRQRVAVARALINKPLVVMADEPTASVHPALADEILQLLIDTVAATGAALIMTSHDTQRVLQYGLCEMRCDIDIKNQLTRLQIHA